jgi:hypothetical protein
MMFLATIAMLAFVSIGHVFRPGFYDDLDEYRKSARRASDMQVDEE